MFFIAFIVFFILLFKAFPIADCFIPDEAIPELSAIDSSMIPLTVFLRKFGTRFLLGLLEIEIEWLEASLLLLISSMRSLRSLLSVLLIIFNTFYYLFIENKLIRSISNEYLRVMKPSYLVVLLFSSSL